MTKIRKRKQHKNPKQNKPKLNYGSSYISELWNPKKTLKQNYETFGLQVKLDGHAGGCGTEYLVRTKEQERIQSLKQVEYASIDPDGNVLYDTVPDTLQTIQHETLEGELKLDPKVTRIGIKINLKNHPSSDLAPTLTASQELLLEKFKSDNKFKPRLITSSSNESLVLRKLVQKYGDDYDKMGKDVKINTYQLSAGQLKRKLVRMK